MLQVALADRFALSNGVVEQWLSKSRLISFIMAQTAVAIHVNDHIALKASAKFHRELDHLGDGFGIFAVDVENGDLEHLGHIRGIESRAPLAGAGGKAKLIINNHV